MIYKKKHKDEFITSCFWEVGQQYKAEVSFTKTEWSIFYFKTNLICNVNILMQVLYIKNIIAMKFLRVQ